MFYQFFVYLYYILFALGFTILMAMTDLLGYGLGFFSYWAMLYYLAGAVIGGIILKTVFYFLPLKSIKNGGIQPSAD